jgi:GDP-L-fucose synthase
MVAEIIGFQGKIVYDSSKPDGTSRKLLDISRLSAMGWKAKVPLQEGLAKPTLTS